jgi:protein associated with RNAse G/E
VLKGSRMQIGDAIMVHKLDHRGHEVWQYPARVIEQAPASLILEAFFDRDSQTIGGITLRHGDRFIETYYTDRWYNIFAVHDGGDGPLKGWYCTIARPARFELGHLFAEDLALDLVVDRLGRWIVLDQEEFERLEIPVLDRERAIRALEELQHLAAMHAAPFVISG